MLEEQIQFHTATPDVLGQNTTASTTVRPRIGLFDSGVGGLSVLRALRRELPEADYIYVGDTARLPYGKRSPHTIIKYSLQASQFLSNHDTDAIVIACNTASSVALSTVQRKFTNTLVKGVVEAGAQAAAAQSAQGRIAMIGTECTVASKAYEAAITAHIPWAEIHSLACPFLVSLAEEGWTDCEVALMTVRKYLTPLLNRFGEQKPDCLILGCTHFSRFSPIIRQLVGSEMILIDPANSLAKEVCDTFHGTASNRPKGPGSVSFHATDSLQRFARVGGYFLGNDIPPNSLKRVELDNL